jgi:methyl-accepting chemotaxis protein
MNIKQKLILAFAVIASLPVILVAVLIILNVHEVRP